jgi:hypothetical protein
VPVNIYIPEGAGQGQVLDKGLKPVALVLPGEDKEGKGSLLARNFAENLARSGFFAVVPDAPGTGERVGPYSSLSAFMLYQAASGFSPAELFITEALLARNLLNNFPAASRDSVHLVAIGDDTYTGAYVALLDTGVKSLTLAGGLFPYGNLVAQGFRPVKALVSGIAGRYGDRAILGAVKSRTKNVQILSTNMLLNPMIEACGRTFGFPVFTMKNDQDFVKDVFAGGMGTLCAFAGGGGFLPAPVQFRGYNDQEKAMTQTIGDQNIVRNSPPQMDVFARPEKAAEKPAPAGAAESGTVQVRMMQPLSTGNGTDRKKILCVDKEGFQTQWIEVKAHAAAPGKVLICLQPFDSAVTDTTLAPFALSKGRTLCLVSLMPEVAGYGDAERAFYDNLLFGISARDRLVSVITAIRNFYRSGPELLCPDSLTAAAGLSLAAARPGIVKRVIVRDFSSGRPDAFFGDIFSGYDGNPLASGEYVNLKNMLTGLIIKDFGDAPVEDYLGTIDAEKTEVILYYARPDDAPGPGVMGEKAKIVTDRALLFPGG